MPDATNIGTYHLADNPQYFEPQRSNTFEFVVTDIDGIRRAGALPDDATAVFSNAQEMLRLSVTQCPIPHYSQEVISVKRGNTTVKYAGPMTFGEGQLTVNDYIGADTKSILMAWQNLSGNIQTEKVGSVATTNYKKDCYLIEYTPDFRIVRQWVLKGCWISSLSEDNYDSESGDKKRIQSTIQYDKAWVDTTEQL